MSRIISLVEELCPQGVPYARLQEIAEITIGDQLNKEILADSGDFPVFNGGIGPSGYHFESNFPENTIAISQGGASAGFVNYMTKPFWAGAHCYAVRSKGRHNNRFLYFILKSQQDLIQSKKIGAGIPGLNRKSLQELSVPVPPLEVQQEIVRILDTFTDLDAELEAGLEARKKQYEYYRNSLIHEIVESSKIFTLGEVCQIFDGTHQTPNYVHQGIKFVSVENIKDLNGSNKYITEEDFHKLYKNKPSRGDLLMTRIGSVGDCAVIDVDEPLAYYVSLALLKPNQMKLASGYLKFYLESSAGKRELYKRTLHQAVPIKINLGDISKLQIAVPSLEMQVSLIRKLEAFQATTESATNGLPAEIVARRKQYEYYRDKLLTFKELEA